MHSIVLSCINISHSQSVVGETQLVIESYIIPAYDIHLSRLTVTFIKYCIDTFYLLLTEYIYYIYSRVDRI